MGSSPTRETTTGDDSGVGQPGDHTQLSSIAADSADRRPRTLAPVPTGPGRRRPAAVADRRGRARRRIDAHPAGAQSRSRSCSAGTPHSELNPDEVVALGAAVQADILVTGNRELLLLDVTPLSLGIETMGGVVSKIILRNSTIPATGSEMFTTAVDNQTAVDIHVLQGERELVADNRSLARFKLRGIPPMPAGHAAGAGAVSDRRQRHPERHRARAARPSVEQTIEVKPSYGLTDDEVERMLLDSFEHAEADSRRAAADRGAERGRVGHHARPRSRCARRISPRSRRDRAHARRAPEDRSGAGRR